MGRNLAFTTARSAVAYQGGVARAVGAWKEGGVWRITRVAVTITADVIPRPDVDVLTSVPPDRDRVLWRGHDPAGALARELGHVWQLPYQRMLRRASVSAAQKDLDATQRERNAAGSFKASKPVPARLGVVDDVYTTGATVSAAARALRSRGAGTVYVVTFARALRTRRRDVASGPVVQPAPLESDQ